MMNKLEALIEAMTGLAIAATAHLGGLPTDMPKAVAAGDNDDAAAREAAFARGTGRPIDASLNPKKARKPRATAKTEEAPATEQPENKLDLGLGLNASTAPEEGKEKKKAPELTEEQSFAEMIKSVKGYIHIAKNDKPVDGTLQIKALLNDKYKVGKVQDLTHAQRLAVIADIGAMTAGHK